jgi:hypothetical protein
VEDEARAGARQVASGTADESPGPRRPVADEAPIKQGVKWIADQLLESTPTAHHAPAVQLAAAAVPLHEGIEGGVARAWPGAYAKSICLRPKTRLPRARAVLDRRLRGLAGLVGRTLAAR